MGSYEPIRRARRRVSTTLISRWSLTARGQQPGRRTSIKRSPENRAYSAILMANLLAGSPKYNKTGLSPQLQHHYGKRIHGYRSRRGNQPTPLSGGQSENHQLYGLTLTASVKREANVIFNDAFSFNQQGLLATDGSWQSTPTFNMSLPDGYGNL